MRRFALLLFVLASSMLVSAVGTPNLPTYTPSSSRSSYSGGVYQSSDQTLHSYGGGSSAAGYSSGSSVGSSAGSTSSSAPSVSFASTSPSSFSSAFARTSSVSAVGAAAPESIVSEEHIGGPHRVKPGGATGGGSGSETGGDSPNLRQPIGDALLPLLLLMLGYAVVLRRRKEAREEA